VNGAIYDHSWYKFKDIYKMLKVVDMVTISKISKTKKMHERNWERNEHGSQQQKLNIKGGSNEGNDEQKSVRP
jgi:hypothetical protein